jgi:hypothetical protein
VQALDRRGDPDSEPFSIRPDQIASAKAGGAGGGWMTPEAAIADQVAARLELRTTGGEKLKLMLMRGEGDLLMSSSTGWWIRSAFTPALRRASSNRPKAPSQVFRSVIGCSMCSVAIRSPFDRLRGPAA